MKDLPYLYYISFFLPVLQRLIYSLKWASRELFDEHRKNKQFQDNYLMCQFVWLHKIKNENKFSVSLTTEMFKKCWIILMETYMAMRLNWYTYD